MHSNFPAFPPVLNPVVLQGVQAAPIGGGFVRSILSFLNALFTFNKLVLQVDLWFLLRRRHYVRGNTEKRTQLLFS